VERPPTDHAIDECWIGEAKVAPATPLPDPASSDEHAVVQIDVPEALEALEQTGTDSPEPRLSDLVNQPAADAADLAQSPDPFAAMDAALLLPAGDPEPELQFDLTSSEDPACRRLTEEVDPIDAALDQAEALTFDAVEELPTEFGIDVVEQPALVDEHLLLASTDASLTSELPDGGSPGEIAPVDPIPVDQIASDDEITPDFEMTPAIAIAPVVDIKDSEHSDRDDALVEIAPVVVIKDEADGVHDQTVVEWSDEVGEDEEVVFPAAFDQAPPATLPTWTAADTQAVVVAEPPVPAEPIAAPRLFPPTDAPAARPIAPAAVPLRRAVRRIVYVQDGAVLPLSARRLRRTMSKVRAAGPAFAVTPTSATTTVPTAGPSNEAFHDDGL
jgi:hypothetical protein